MKVRVFLIGGESVYEVAETLDYENVRSVKVEGSNVGSTLMLHRGCGNVGIPFMRVHHWEETGTEEVQA